MAPELLLNSSCLKKIDLELVIHAEIISNKTRTAPYGSVAAKKRTRAAWQRAAHIFVKPQAAAG
jgi:hypothetical protein